MDVAAAMELLRNRCRRQTVRHLDGIDEASVDEIVASLNGGQLSEDVELELVHTHLPKLDDAQVIEYDHSDGFVEVVDVQSLIDVLDSVESVLEE